MLNKINLILNKIIILFIQTYNISAIRKKYLIVSCDSPFISKLEKIKNCEPELISGDRPWNSSQMLKRTFFATFALIALFSEIICNKCTFSREDRYRNRLSIVKYGVSFISTRCSSYRLKESLSILFVIRLMATSRWFESATFSIITKLLNKWFRLIHEK